MPDAITHEGGLGFARDEWAKPPSALSGGEQTRASLARLVIADPDLLLLDEPTAGMSPEESHEFGELLLQIRKQLGVTITTFLLTEGAKPQTIAAALGTFGALALTALLFGVVVRRAQNDPAAAATRGIACSALAIPAIVLAFLGLPYPLAAAGIALGLRGHA